MRLRHGTVRRRYGTGGAAALAAVALLGLALTWRGVAADQATNRARATAYRSVLIKDVPHVRQKPDFCGEACAAMYLGKLGHAGDQDYVFDLSGLNPLEARGCYTRDLATALRAIGFEVGPIFFKVQADQSAQQIEDQWKAMHADLLAGVPSIVCTHYDAKPNTTEHFRLVLGYDAAKDEVIYHEPSAADGAYQRMKRATLLALWPLKYDPKEWTLVRLRLEPTAIKPAKRAETFTAADYAQHMMRLREKMPREGFTRIIQAPFVVISDESPEVVKQRAQSTVQWAVEKLKAAYFTKDPAEILDIWLFRDKASYDKHCQDIFHHEPTTPYGFFSHTDKALVMNIATGGGTLVHELVHPLMATNFPECPAWFNEGLGSLYEQSAERDGQIVGLTNWRLAGLQEAIRDKRVPSFETLCSTTDDEFYQKDKGTNYAQARYLCYYLQEQGLLRKFYQRFHADYKKDPGGYNTLQAVLGRRDMEEFQKEWAAYVLKLRFRG